MRRDGTDTYMIDQSVIYSAFPLVGGGAIGFGVGYIRVSAVLLHHRLG
jgi:hypothetical protein